MRRSSPWLCAASVLATGLALLTAQVPRPAQSAAPKPAKAGAPPQPKPPQKQPPTAPPKSNAPARETAASFTVGLPQVAPLFARLPAPPLEKLANGMGVVVVHDPHLPLVDIALMVSSGYGHDPTGKRGLTRAVAQTMRFGGTLRKTEKDLETYLANRSLGLQVLIGPELTQWAVRCRKEDLPETLELLAELFTQPAFRRDAIESFHRQLRSSIQTRGQNLDEAGAHEIEASWFGSESPMTRRYGYSDLRAIDRESIVAHFEKTVVPSRIVIGLSGDIDANAARQLLGKTFGSWTAAAGEPARPMPLPVPTRKLIALDKPNSPYARLLVALPFAKRGPQRDASESAVLALLAAQLEFARDASLGTLMAPFTSNEEPPRISPGLGLAEVPMLRIFVPLRPREAIDGTVALWKELQTLRAGKISAPSLDAAKRSVLRNIVYQTATAAARFQFVVEAAAMGVSPGYLESLQQAVMQMTPAEYERLIKQQLNLEAAQLVLIGDERDYRSPSESAGFPVVRASAVPPPEPPATPVDETAARAEGLRVLAEAQKAMGGAELLSAIRDATWHYEAKLLRAATPVVVSQQNSWLQPGFYRQEQTASIGNGISYYDGKVGWSHNGRNLLSLSPQLALQYRNEVIRLLFRIVRAGEMEGYKIAYMGSGVVKITSPENYQVELAVDFKTNLPERLRFLELRPTDSATISVEEQLSDFKRVDGVLMPHRILVKQLGQEFADFKMTQMRFNTGLTEEQMSRKP